MEYPLPLKSEPEQAIFSAEQATDTKFLFEWRDGKPISGFERKPHSLFCIGRITTCVFENGWDLPSVFFLPLACYKFSVLGRRDEESGKSLKTGLCETLRLSSTFIDRF